MNRFLKLLFLLGLCLTVAVGCSKTKTPMPLTKENLQTYLQAVSTTMKSVTPQEVEEAKKSTDKQKEVFRKAFIKPMEQMGYSYDATVADLAKKVLAKSLQTPDPATTAMTSDFLTIAKDMRETALKFGFISKETKGLLDQVNAVFPRTLVPQG